MSTKLPDFLVIGAQKAGTTTLFALLRKHPHIYLPPQKEVQYFSNDELFTRGLNWYMEENFRTGNFEGIAGEISPQYMFRDLIPERIKAALPNVKLIAILRHPLKRAFSHYQMSVRRGLENRDFRSAFEASVDAKSNGLCLDETTNYYQFSAYREILIKYLQLFPKEQLLILFQEDLDSAPETVLNQIHEFLGVEHIVPDKPDIRLHAAGTIKYRWLHDLVMRPSILRRILKTIIPSRLRSAIIFWVEQLNIKRDAPQTIPADVLQDFDWIVREQADFLSALGIPAPWKSGRF